MRVRAVVPALFLAVLLAACSFSQPSAPVRESRAAKRVVRPPASMPTFYRVQPGDNLFRIALDHGLEYRQLAVWNGIDEPSRIQAGDLLRLTPPARPAVGVKPGPDTAAGPATEPEFPDDPPSQWLWPAKGQVVARFGASSVANGLDISGQRGSPVVAAADGKVVYVGSGLRGYGKLIIIKHSRFLLSAYGHNDRILVAEGQRVRVGQSIAEMGDSDADRVKLHFEVREYGKPVDPMEYLPG